MILNALKETVKNFMSDDPMSQAASIAFYTIISLPAILLLSINVLSVAYNSEHLEENLLDRMNHFLGPNTAQQAEVIIQNATTAENNSSFAWLGWLILLFSATTVFISLQDGINSIWNVKLDSDIDVKKLLKDRLISFGIIMSLGFILLVSLVLDSFISMLDNWLAKSSLMINEGVIIGINYISTLVVTVLIFSMIFKYLPDVKTKWTNVIAGGIFTALLFSLGKIVIGLYLNNADVGNAYGASGSLVVFLFWVYYSSILILLGARFTYEYTLLKGNKISSLDFAVIEKD